MILLDTNVLIYASTDQSPFLEWARAQLLRNPSSFPVPRPTESKRLLPW